MMILVCVEQIHPGLKSNEHPCLLHFDSILHVLTLFLMVPTEPI